MRSGNGCTPAGNKRRPLTLPALFTFLAFFAVSTTEISTFICYRDESHVFNSRWPPRILTPTRPGDGINQYSFWSTDLRGN